MKSIKKVLTFIWNLIRTNWVLKIMAVLFAIILWSYVLAETNPQREIIISDIPLRYTNTSELMSKGLDISDSLSEMVEKVNVRVEVRQNELKYVSKDNVFAFVDLSAVNKRGQNPLRITAQTAYGRISSISPATVSLYIDDYVTKQVPVSLVESGFVAQGYYADTPVIYPNIINVSGPRIDVEKVASAVCVVELDGVTEGYSRSVDVELLDREGNVVDKALFTNTSPSIIVRLDVFRKKTVPIDITGSVFGKNDIAAGYEIADIVCTPNEIEIAGELSVLQNVSSINLVPYNIGSGENTSIVVLLDYQLPQGIRALTAEKAKLFINIREIMDTKLFPRVEIQTKNLSGGKTARLSVKFVDVTVLAGISRIASLGAENIAPYVDLKGLSEGTYTLDVRFVLPPGFTENNFSSSVSTVTVTIS